MEQQEQRVARRAYRFIFVGMALAAALPIAYFALAPRLAPPAEPGNLSSPTLAKLLNENIDKAVADQDPVKWPGLIPEAAANSRGFLREVAEVVVRCSMGPLEPNQKYNRVVYHVVRVDGFRYEPKGTLKGCGENSLIYRATFKDGRVAEAFTDGRERQYGVDQVRGMVTLRELGKALLALDMTHHPERYYRSHQNPSPPSPPRDVSKDWE